MPENRSTNFEGKEIVKNFDDLFARLHKNSCALVRSIPPGKLYWQPREATQSGFPLHSCGEHVLRSAAVVEQTFGGITVNLWDDPFEWTLPEAHSTAEQVLEYFEEVEATRQRSFTSFASDGDLLKKVALPSGEMQSLFALLAETLVRAAHQQGSAFAIFRLFSNERLPRV